MRNRWFSLINKTPCIDLLFTGPVIRESPTLQKQVCLIRADTNRPDLVIAAAPGGASAGWTLPPVWQYKITERDEEDQLVLDEDDHPVVDIYTCSNPRINKKEELMWLLVRNIEC